MSMDSSVDTYWMKLLVREWAHFCIFLYIGYAKKMVSLMIFLFKTNTNNFQIMTDGFLGHKIWHQGSLLCQLTNLKETELFPQFTAL